MPLIPITSLTRRFVATLVTLAAFLLLVLPASAGRQVAFSWSLNSWSLQNPVEQQTCSDWLLGTCDSATWVYNHTACAWDFDDHLDYQGYGVLDGEATADLCVIDDDGYHSPNRSGTVVDLKVIYLRVLAPSADLTVTLSDSLGGSWTASPVPAHLLGAHSKDGYEYRVCVIDPEFDSWPEVPDSNGGVGVRLDYHASVTGSRERGIIGYFGAALASDNNSADCVSESG